MDPAILGQAADWLVLLQAGTATDADRAACARWRAASPEHARAWQRAERLLNKLGTVPPALAMPALDRPARGGRRAATAKLALLLAALPGGWLAWRVSEERGWAADHRTAAGQTRSLRLADGTALTLDTDTAVDVAYDDGQRLLRLHRGGILVETAPDVAAVHRPFRVQTPQGRLQALGTRFDVRCTPGRTRLSVLQGAVRVSPLRAAPAVVQAGQQLAFTESALEPAARVDAAATAWTQGMLLADGMPLADFAAELARWHPGVLRLDPGLAGLRISGAYPVADLPRVLRMLEATYPLQVRTRLHGWWITLVPRGPSAPPGQG